MRRSPRPRSHNRMFPSSSAGPLPRLLVQLIGKVRLHRRPFAGNDAVDHRIAQRAVRCNLMVAQDTVEFCSQPFDAAPALMIAKLRAEFDRNAIEFLERMGE